MLYEEVSDVTHTVIVPDRQALEDRIKTLTTIIHTLKPQIASPTSGNARSADGRAYDHVATLLTRGVEVSGPGRGVIAVTGAHKVTGAVVIALSSDAAPPLDEESAQVHLSVAQNSLPKILKEFHVQEVEPNPLSLAEICRTLCVFLLLVDLSPHLRITQESYP